MAEPASRAVYAVLFIDAINVKIRVGQVAYRPDYLALMSLDPTGRGRQRWTNRWKAALNAFDITFDGRLSAGRK